VTVDLFQCDCECGCAAKVPADRLAGILKDLDLPEDSRVLVGPETLDDAGVYRIDNERCLVQTVDFFPPVARDPCTYGQIAAANALSDVYAMGGRPLTALAIVCFPADRFGPDVLKEITRGATDKLREAGAVLLGGHSIVDREPKYGLAVTGVIDRDRVLDNMHLQPGDVLVLTKPLGTGITIMAARGGVATAQQESAANRCMSTLNAAAARIALDCGARSCTDITGFGLLGHAMQMAKAAGVTLDIAVDRLPKLDGAIEYAGMGLLSSAAYANRKYVNDAAAFDEDITRAEQDLLFDPQTSGGLLIACPRDRVKHLLERAGEKLTTPYGTAGTVRESRQGPLIRVRRHGRSG